MLSKVVFPIVGILLTISISAAFAASSISIENDNVFNFIEQSDLCLKEHNDARKENGLGAFKADAKLTQAAQFHNDWMIKNNCFDHNCDGEPEMGDRISDTGYEWSSVAENIIVNRGDCKEAVAGWMKSPGHKANILSENVNIGCARGTCDNCDWKNYWTCVFATSF